MVDGVADQVDHRVAQPLDDRAVEPRFLTDDPQLDLLARAVGQVADHPRESREELVDRNHPQVERRVPDLPADALEGLKGMNPGLDAANLAQAHQVVRHHDQLAGQPHQIIKLRGVDPNSGVRPRAQERGRPRLDAGGRRGRGGGRRGVAAGGRRGGSSARPG